MATEFALVPDLAHFETDDGDLASGYQLFIYTAGSSAKATTHTESDGLVANTNPIILDARGEMPNGCYVASGSYKLVLATDTDTDPPATPVRTRDNIKPVNDTATTQSEWVDSGLTPTFVGTTSFTLVGDQTSTFTVGRRLKTTLSAGTGYHTIVTSAYTSLTTITVINDSTVLDSGLTAVSYGLLSSDNSAMPWVQVTASGIELDGSLIMKQGADVASASDLLVNIPGNSFDVTGTTQIDTIATKGVGTHITLQFDGALILAHDATNLDLGDANITTAAGDVAVFWEYAVADWRLVSYKRTSGQAFHSINLLAESDLTNAGADDLTLLTVGSIPAGVKRITITGEGVSTNGTSAYLVQVGDAGGPESSGYLGSYGAVGGSASLTPTTGFQLSGSVIAGGIYDIKIVLELTDAANFTWSAATHQARTNAANLNVGFGMKSLSAELDRITLTTAGGSDTFDAGTLAVSYES